jgi:uncharacterized protein YjbI with pentapeptide repeats
MADPDHPNMLRQGSDAWNAWREGNPDITPDLSEADLSEADLSRADLRGANLNRAHFDGANLSEADLSGADLRRADLGRAKLWGADLSGAHLGMAVLRGADLRDAILRGARLGSADLSGANLSGAALHGANLNRAHFDGANLSEANLSGANLRRAHFDRANLLRAGLNGANLTEANLSGANLNKADLSHASLVDADITNADLTGCRIYGVSAWNVKLSDTKQHDLVITAAHEPEVTVDNIEVAQFVYLLLHNEKIRDVIDTVGKKGVLLLGRFTEGRIAVLERLRAELRERGYLPMVFNFDKPETKDFTETVRLLAGLSHFVIADVTNPRSAPLELQLTVPEIMVPFLPIIEEGQKPVAMLEGLFKYDWVFEPLYYSSLDALVGALSEKIIGPAEARFEELMVRRLGWAEKMKGQRV